MNQNETEMRVFECAGKRYRMTPQRQAVLDVLRRADSHLDAAWVYERVRKAMPDITLPTVERTIHLLRQAGFLDEPAAKGRASQFPTTTKRRGLTDLPVPSCQVRCVHCGRTVKLRSEDCQELANQAGSATGFVIHQHLEFHGLCPACARELSSVAASS